MDKQIEELTGAVKSLSIYDEEKIIKIQKLFRGRMWRLKTLPNIMWDIRKYLRTQAIQFSTQNKDGRINSCIDEDKIITILIKKYGKRIKRAPPRMWYDMLAYDYRNGWLPINIKTTTMRNSDNVGNLTMCVYAYTNEPIDLHYAYQNGDMSTKLFNKLKNKQFNTINKRDYYFLVFNKNNPKDIIINSLKGLTNLTSNSNNLPFQVVWKNNRDFIYEPIRDKVQLFVNCLQNTKVSWQEVFLANMHTLEL